ncbi:hypothetical protein HYR69_06480, partial [Candidatus Sumerlaeota bacterium]|nr:hypothetical protein [Candidatus Sumerlaeota bacterium]
IHYCYEKDVFPTARCEIEVDGNRLVSCKMLDGRLDTDYGLPPLRVAELRAGGELAGRRPRLRSLAFSFEGREVTWDESSPREMLLSLRSALREADPDLIWTCGGDSVLMPALLALAAQCKVNLNLDREPGIARRPVFEGRSYMSYGRVLYQAPDYPLFGRWHIDRENSFWSSETGLSGLIEVARLSKIPVQRAARRSIGTGISSIQLDHAYRNGILIPWKKSQPEAWKSAATLIKSDRGGLVYQPVTGVYEDVVELDFVSMYPTIMTRCNVSPETIECGCCPREPIVPEIGYSICRKRRGLTSAVLEPIIEKRKRYKALMKQTMGERRAAYDGRQGAIKWLLVCCFGYLGYRNARFGRIEAHEATCAFSREKLIRAKEICEEAGFRVIHAIVDCVWVQKRGIKADEIEMLCRAVNEATGLDIAVEGRYRWIVFLPSRQNPAMPVPNRYFGCFEEGRLKFRGIEIRRHDQAPYAQKVQEDLLERLRGAENLAAIRAMQEDLAALVRDAVGRLRRREVPIEQLLLRRKTSQEAGEYRSNNMTAVAARQAVRAGFSLHAGESVSFLVVDGKNRDPDSRLRIPSLLEPENSYDVEFYAEQVRRAAATLLEPLLGMDLKGAFTVCDPEPKRSRRNLGGGSKVRQPHFWERTGILTRMTMDNSS